MNILTIYQHSVQNISISKDLSSNKIVRCDLVITVVTSGGPIVQSLALNAEIDFSPGTVTLNH